VRSKTQAIDDLTQQIEQLQAFIPKLEDLGREGFPYLEGALTRTELQLRECIKRAFGDKSPEFQTHRHLKLALSSSTEKKQTLTLIRGLIASLEDKKLEMQGLKPPITQDPTPASASPTLTLVPPACSTAPISVTTTTAQPTVTTVHLLQGVENSAVPTAQVASAAPPASPSTPAVAEPTPAPVPPTRQSIPPRTPIEPISSLFRTQETKPVPPTQDQSVSTSTRPPSVVERELSAAPSPLPHQSTAPAVLANPAPEAPPAAGAIAAPSVAPKSPTTDAFSTTQEVPKPGPTCTVQTPSLPSPVPNAAAATAAEADHLSITKKVCQRFHVVARQLRLRGEYRSTVNVEDECDVQDLMHALLRQHFDDIGTDEWIPSYTNGVARTTFLLDHDRLAIVVKKTRTGLSRKELADQIRADLERYRDRGRCTQLVCFIYDPEGRIGNPRGLESELSATSEHFAVDVVVAPK
jgi:hypothetical protein